MKVNFGISNLDSKNQDFMLRGLTIAEVAQNFRLEPSPYPDTKYNLFEREFIFLP